MPPLGAAWTRFEKQIHAGRGIGQNRRQPWLLMRERGAPRHDADFGRQHAPGSIAEVAEKVDAPPLRPNDRCAPRLRHRPAGLDASLGLVSQEPRDYPEGPGRRRDALATQIGIRAAMRGPVLMFQLEMEPEGLLPAKCRR